MDKIIELLEQIETIKVLKTTKLSSCILQVLILTLFLKDTSKSNKVIQRAVDMILNKDQIKDIFCNVMNSYGITYHY